MTRSFATTLRLDDGEAVVECTDSEPLLQQPLAKALERVELGGVSVVAVLGMVLCEGVSPAQVIGNKAYQS